MTITKMGKMGVVMAFYSIVEESETCIRDTEIGAGVHIIQSLSLYKMSMGSLAP